MSEDGYLLDTNVLSEFNRNQPPDAKVKQWVAARPWPLLYVSVITISEIRFGIELLAESKRRKMRQRWLDEELHRWFDVGRILPIDEQIGTIWARMTAQRQLDGRPLDILDGLIAATAFAGLRAASTPQSYLASLEGLAGAGVVRTVGYLIPNWSR